jgi:hypothetical protein
MHRRIPDALPHREVRDSHAVDNPLQVQTVAFHIQGGLVPGYFFSVAIDIQGNEDKPWSSTIENHTH